MGAVVRVGSGVQVGGGVKVFDFWRVGVMARVVEDKEIEEGAAWQEERNSDAVDKSEKSKSEM
ncbi:MAG: hypothetical protein AB9891_05235 [Anaerolineaceae bacterium]